MHKCLGTVTVWQVSSQQIVSRMLLQIFFLNICFNTIKFSDTFKQLALIRKHYLCQTVEGQDYIILGNSISYPTKVMNGKLVRLQKYESKGCLSRRVLLYCCCWLVSWPIYRKGCFLFTMVCLLKVILLIKEAQFQVELFSKTGWKKY